MTLFQKIETCTVDADLKTCYQNFESAVKENEREKDFNPVEVSWVDMQLKN
jgi:hypothetical protein